MKSNSLLQHDVMAELQWEPSLHAAEIGVAAKNGVITLTGTVDCYAKKSEAEDAAKKVSGVVAVIENIEVKYPGTWAKKDDSDIANEIIAAFKTNSEIPSERIKAIVEKGFVTLEGVVQSNFQRVAARKAVQNLRGVMGVVNNISIAIQVENTIEVEEIENAIARNWSISNKHIAVTVSGHQATLRGQVNSWYQKNEAERLAWNAPGVSNVENELVVEYD